jgi:hypothetical protein
MAQVSEIPSELRIGEGREISALKFVHLFFRDASGYIKS